MREKPIVVLSDVGKTFPGFPPVVALSGISLFLDKGTYTAVLGPSGSGKSTLLNLLGLLDRPTSGRYLLEGIDTAGLDENRRSEARASRLGFVFQGFHLLPHRTARENVELPLLYRGSITLAERRERAEAALRSVGMEHRAAARPGTMSGGEKQRVAIARAIVSEPALLLCDEPTGNLDSATRDQILDVLDELNADGATIVVITHDPEVAARTDEVVQLSDGRWSTSRAAVNHAS